jgi:hypothetical protein
MPKYGVQWFLLEGWRWVTVTAVSQAAGPDVGTIGFWPDTRLFDVVA